MNTKTKTKLVFICSIFFTLFISYVFINKEDFDPLNNKNLVKNMECHQIPKTWMEVIKAFSKENREEGKILRAALNRNPRVCIGPTKLYLGRDIAVTIDNLVLVPSKDDLSRELLVHELVHVYQYSLSGKYNFLYMYFTEIVARYVAGKLLHRQEELAWYYRATSFEVQAKAIDLRFTVWSINEGLPKIMKIISKWGSSSNL